MTNEQLASQARAAADQALQLAKLAEESARLAKHLNEQVLVRSGQSLPDRVADGSPPVEMTPAGPFLPEVHVSAAAEDLSPATLAVRRGRRRRRPSLREQWERRGMHQPPVGMPRQITIRAAPDDLERTENPVDELVRNWKSVSLSTGLHVAVLFVLGVLTFVIEPDHPIDTILASFVDAERTVEQALPIEEPVQEPGEPESKESLPEEPTPQEIPAAAVPPPEPVPKEAIEAAARPTVPVPGPQPAAAEPAVDLAKVGSRSAAGKALLLKKYGGTAASESAVGRALDWFVSVQRRDGSWNFNDVGRASHAGDVNNPLGATSYVLLAFLGAGQTHQQGKYKADISQGLRFLLQNARVVPAGADFRGLNVEESHNFYVQGAAAMALCEAYAMTNDRKLRSPAQGAVNFIIAAQDPRGGGWRYAPREAGCTSVTTLQLTALMSAQRCGLNVPPRVLDGMRHFYTTVKCDEGPGRYSYRAEQLSYKAASSAQAALGRMYLGAAREDEDLRAAVGLLDQRGPYENRYYCYYATQVLKNWGGPEWERWNQSLRDELVRTQESGDGPGRDSWAPLQRGPTDVSGGRLFATALSTMTLEVYYRYLPLYDLETGGGDDAGAGTTDGAAADAPVASKTTP